jgi:hypothetical protein
MHRDYTIRNIDTILIFFNLFSVSRDVFTPFHIGLAIQLYHDIGSKQLIETLHSNGFCASYGEVKRYLTSIAHHEIEKNQDNQATSR